LPGPTFKLVRVDSGADVFRADAEPETRQLFSDALTHAPAVASKAVDSKFEAADELDLGEGATTASGAAGIYATRYSPTLCAGERFAQTLVSEASPSVDNLSSALDRAQHLRRTSDRSPRVARTPIPDPDQPPHHSEPQKSLLLYFFGIGGSPTEPQPVPSICALQ
jgi:hypothetical protein